MTGVSLDTLAGDDRGQLGVFAVIIFAAVALVILAIILLLGVALIGGIVDGVGGQTDPISKTASPDPIVGESVEFADTRGQAEITEVYGVRDSRGYAVSLTGASDSYVQTNADVTLASDATWTIGTWARADPGAVNETITALSADGELLLQYNGTSDQWVAWYYDTAARDSYRVTVAATDPTAYTWVGARHNGTHLTIYRNGTEGGTVATDGGSDFAPIEVNSTNWDGELDETRAVDDALTQSQIDSHVADPIAPLPGTNRTARVMYDAGAGTSTPIYFTGTSMTLSNASWTTGLPGHSLTDGVDYELDAGDGTITALADGRIDGAPVVFVEFEYLDRNDVANLGYQLTDAIVFMAQSAIVIPAAAVLALLFGGLIVGLRRVDTGGSDMPNGRSR